MIIVDLTTGQASTDLDGMRTRLKGRGFDYLTDTQCDQLLNESYMELCDLYDWPFLETTSTGTAPPVTLTDLRKVLSVVDTENDQPLDPVSKDVLLRKGYDLTTAGAPCQYYIEAGTQINAYPVGGVLSIRYLTVPVLLALGSDTPVVPERYRDIIVTGAARKALLDESDTSDFGAVDGEYQRRLAVMVGGLLGQTAEATFIETRCAE